MYELENIDKLDIDFRNEQIVKEFAESVNKQLEPYRVKAQEVGINKAEESRKFITKIKNKVAKFFKEKREAINKQRDSILNAEKTANKPLLELESFLKKDIADEEHRLLMEARKRTLPAKLETLKAQNIDIPEDTILAMTEAEFLQFLQETLEQREREAKRKEAEEQRIKEAEERGREQAKLEIISAPSIKKVNGYIPQVDLAVKNFQEKVDKFLKENNFNKEIDHVIREGSKVKLYRIIAEADFSEKQEAKLLW